MSSLLDSRNAIHSHEHISYSNVTTIYSHCFWHLWYARGRIFLVVLVLVSLNAYLYDGTDRLAIQKQTFHRLFLFLSLETVVHVGGKIDLG